MKKLLLFTFLLLILTGCSGEPKDIVDQLGQRYTEADLYTSSSNLSAHRYGNIVNGFYFEAAGLHEKTDHFIVVYTNGEQRFWIETAPLKRLPFGTVLDVVQKSRNGLVCYTIGSEQSPYVAIYLDSDNMTPDEILASVDFLDVYCWTERKWLHDEQFTGPHALQRFDYPDTLHLHTRWIKAGGDTLTYDFLSAEFEPNAMIRRYYKSQWRDTELKVTVPSNEGEVFLDLDAGYYALVLRLKDGHQISYPFAVGNLSQLSAVDLPQGRKTTTAQDVVMEFTEYDPVGKSIRVDVHYGADPNAWTNAQDNYAEVKLDGKWCALPCIDRRPYAEICGGPNRDMVSHLNFSVSTKPSAKLYYLFPFGSEQFRVVCDFTPMPPENGNHDPNMGYLAAEFKIS